MSRMNRRTLLRSMALAAGGAAVSAVTADQVMAAEPAPVTGEGARETGARVEPQALTFPSHVAYSGGDFKPTLSATGYAFTGGGLNVYYTGGGNGEFETKVQLPTGAVITNVVFYVVNSSASTGYMGILVWIPATATFQNVIFQPPAASTSGIQTVNVPLPAGGIPVDNAVRSTTLLWRSSVATIEQILHGARVAYSLSPGLANFLPAPVRVADTRPATLVGPVSGPLVDGGTYDFQIAGANGIPANATAVFGNLTAVEFNPGNGYMSLFPTGAATPNVSSLNFGGGEPNQLANFFQVKLGTGGKVRLYVSGTSTNAILDIAGYVI